MIKRRRLNTSYTANRDLRHITRKNGSLKKQDCELRGDGSCVRHFKEDSTESWIEYDATGNRIRSRVNTEDSETITELYSEGDKEIYISPNGSMVFKQYNEDGKIKYVKELDINNGGRITINKDNVIFIKYLMEEEKDV